MYKCRTPAGLGTFSWGWSLEAANSGLPTQSPSKRRESTESHRCLAKDNFGKLCSRENGNHVGRNHVGRFTRTGCTCMLVQVPLRTYCICYYLSPSPSASRTFPQKTGAGTPYSSTLLIKASTLFRYVYVFVYTYIYIYIYVYAYPCCM